MRHKVMGLAGHVRSGKTSAGDYLQKRYGAEVFVNSVPIGEIVSKIGAPQDRKSYADIAMAVFDVLGRDIIARHWLRLIGQNEADSLYVVEGIRYPEELLLYRERTRFFLIGIESGDEIRYGRSKFAADSQKDKGQSFTEFCKQKRHRNELFIDDIVLQADARIVNNGSLDQFHSLLSSAVENFTG